ncbi:MAG: alanine--tRNA ligase [Bdellovibrionota bacterium]
MKPVKGNEIREAFLSYFEKQGHARVASSKLVPDNDPTLLFTTAGMVQFKDTFLGLEKRPYSRATSSQKCVRAGGKHNDLENVGFTERHHTFFEMLGNFSFGDYFKKEAIHFAWEFVTKDLGLPKDRLRVSVFETDDESAEIWHKQEGVPKDRIVRFGEEDNFWAMGDEGPCGPCSEIFWDQGKEVDGDRWLEFWNVVFMQYNRKNGVLTPLERPSVDTGMGLERMCTVMQGVESNYEIDLFTDLIKATHAYFENSLKHKIDLGNRENLCATRVIVDHLRSTSFLIADGVMPSNEGRGYVLRRILRRAVRFGHKLGIRDPFLEKIYPALEASLADVYPELSQRKSYILDVLKQEEVKFFETLDRGIELLDDAMKKGENSLAPDTVFKLYDTFGFPFDLTELIAQERGIKIEMNKVEELLSKQQEMSRASWKGSGAEALPNSVKEWQSTLKTTPKFYEASKTESKVLGIESTDTGSWIALDPCPFYAESGGQVGDSGKLVDKSGKTFLVSTCKKVADGLLALRIEGPCSLKVGDIVSAEVDDARRTKIRANHTSTHLLHASLRKYLGTHVHQAGSFLDDTRLRFDFSHNKSVSEEEKQKIEDWVNEQIQGAHKVTIESMSHKDATAKGAMALFGEKYGDTVRVVDIEGTPSMELCGGLHVANTQDIKRFKLIKESGVSSGVRRVEAVSGTALEDYLQEEITQKLKRVSTLNEEIFALQLSQPLPNLEKASAEENLKVINTYILEAEEKIQTKKKELKKQEDEAFREKVMSQSSDIAEDFAYKGHTLQLLAFEDSIAIDKLREIVDQARSKAAKDKVAFMALSKLGFFVSKTNESSFPISEFRQLLVAEQKFKGGGDENKAQGKVPPELNFASLKEWLKSKQNA